MVVCVCVFLCTVISSSGQVASLVRGGGVVPAHQLHAPPLSLHPSSTATMEGAATRTGTTSSGTTHIGTSSSSSSCSSLSSDDSGSGAASMKEKLNTAGAALEQEWTEQFQLPTFSPSGNYIAVTKVLIAPVSSTQVTETDRSPGNFHAPSASTSTSTSTSTKTRGRKRITVGTESNRADTSESSQGSSSCSIEAAPTQSQKILNAEIFVYAVPTTVEDFKTATSILTCSEPLFRSGQLVRGVPVSVQFSPDEKDLLVLSHEVPVEPVSNLNVVIPAASVSSFSSPPIFSASSCATQNTSYTMEMLKISWSKYTSVLAGSSLLNKQQQQQKQQRAYAAGRKSRAPGALAAASKAMSRYPFSTGLGGWLSSHGVLSYQRRSLLRGRSIFYTYTTSCAENATIVAHCKDVVDLYDKEHEGSVAEGSNKATGGSGVWVLVPLHSSAANNDLFMWRELCSYSQGQPYSESETKNKSRSEQKQMLAETRWTTPVCHSAGGGDNVLLVQNGWLISQALSSWKRHSLDDGHKQAGALASKRLMRVQGRVQFSVSPDCSRAVVLEQIPLAPYSGTTVHSGGTARVRAGPTGGRAGTSASAGASAGMQSVVTVIDGEAVLDPMHAAPFPGDIALEGSADAEEDLASCMRREQRHAQAFWWSPDSTKLLLLTSMSMLAEKQGKLDYYCFLFFFFFCSFLC
jgi:hypothetical protein